MGNGLGLDIRAGIRALSGSRTISAAAVLTLTLAMGALTALFTVLNGLILRPLPVSDPQRVVTITSETALRFGYQGGAGWSYAMWERLRERVGAFDGAFAWMLQPLDLAQTGESQPVEGLFASGDFFRTLGVQPIAGRAFTGADDVRGGGPDGALAVISYDLWQRQFNGAASAVGSRLFVEGTPVTIVGVAPRGFRGVHIGQPFDIALPLGLEPLIRGHRSVVDNRRSLLLSIMLKRKPAQSLSEATATLRAMQPGIVGSDAPQIQREPFVLFPAAAGISALRQQYERPLVTLSIVSALMLLIVCVNVANLFLARAAARRHDLSVQLAVGAPRWRLARQLFVEGLSLGGISAVAGTIFAVWASRALVTQLPATGPSVALDLPIDWRVIVFIGTVAIATVVLFVTAPAAYAARVPSIEALTEERDASGGRRTGAVTGVTHAAGSAWTPFGSGGGGLLTDARGRRAEVEQQVAFNFVTPGWFATYATALRAGRDFDRRDGAGASRVAIVNEALRRSMPGVDSDIVGTTIHAGPCQREGCTVIGLVADAVYGRSLRDLPPPTLYLPSAQSAGLAPPDATFRVTIRSSARPTSLISTLTETARAVDPALRLTFRSLDRDVTASLAQERLIARLAGFFGAVALLLSVIGLHGVTSFAVSRRRGEIGIRMALGGRPFVIVRELLRRIGVCVLVGTALGVLAASWLAHYIAPLVYGLEPRDPATLVASTATLASVAVVAALLPAWRATRVEPAQSLRQH